MTATPSPADAASALDDRAKDEAVEHLRALLRLDTTNPPGNERPAIDHIAAALRREGIEPRILEPAPGRANLVARLRGDGSAPPLLLTSHVDVVTAEPARWTHGPFSGDIADGWLFGRGAVDMKGMTAMELASFLALERSGAKLKRDVILLVLADEEAGMEWGSKWVVDNEPDLIRAEYALNEVGGFSTTVGGKRLYLVGTGEKGVCWLRLRAKGEPGHGSMPHDRNAVLRLTRAVEALAAARLSSDVRPAARAFFDEVAKALGRPASLVLAGLHSPLTREASLRALALLDREQARIFRCMLYQTCTPTGLRAGKKENVIPSEAEAIVDGRFLPGTTREGFLREVRRAVGPGIEVEELHGGDPTEVPLDAPLFATIAAKTARHDPDGRAIPWLNVGFTDATHLSRIGVKCYGFYPLRLPPDLKFATLFHGHDERVPLEGYRFGLGLFHDVVRSFATGEAP
jgi:acetylornithine deacetylase/succinyl-diaminopimelate desuccinylase-like protein